MDTGTTKTHGNRTKTSPRQPSTNSSRPMASTTISGSIVARGAIIHYVRKCKQYDKEQHFEGTVAKRKHTMAVLKARHKQEAEVVCEGKPLENCFTFRYLGSMFAADGTEETDLRRRIGMATTRCGQLRFVMGSNKVNLTTKLKIYKCAVGSLFTYGNEAWNLNAKAGSQDAQRRQRWMLA